MESLSLFFALTRSGYGKCMKKLICALALASHVVSTPAQTSLQEDTQLFAENILISTSAFFLVNWAQYRKEWGQNIISTPTLLALSGLEVGKNLVNYVLIENKNSLTNSVLSVILHNTLRRQLSIPVQTSVIQSVFELAFAEVLKNRVNFVITEGWFPSSWSRPPQSPTFLDGIVAHSNPQTHTRADTAPQTAPSDASERKESKPTPPHSQH